VEKFDEWGQDPSIRMMRRVFAQMEFAQREFFDCIGITPFDSRVGQWRFQARGLFEDLWANRLRSGEAPDEKTVAALYLGCLVECLRKDGVFVPDECRDEPGKNINRDQNPK